MGDSNQQLSEEEIERLKQVEANKARAERARPTAAPFVANKTVGGYIREVNKLPPTAMDVGLQESPVKPTLRDHHEGEGGDTLKKSSSGALVAALIMVGCSLLFVGFMIYKIVS